MSKELGKHLIADLVGCDVEKLKFVPAVQDALTRAAEASGATLLSQSFRQFDPQGVSGVILIAESHLSVHTWPEDSFAAFDIFTCNAEMEVQAALDIMKEALGAAEVWVTEISRGTSPGVRFATEHTVDKQ